MIGTLASGANASTRSARVRGLYAVTPDLADTTLLVALVEAALRGGAALVQYRNKVASAALLREQAVALAACCAAAGRPFVVNDHVELALSIDDAGLHVGRDDASPDALHDLRDRLGPSRLFGVSCYRSVDAARTACEAGADYVAFGSMFPSTTKASAPAAPATLFAQARPLGVPLVGIGGITDANLPSLIDAGCDAAAIIAALFVPLDPASVEASARRLSSVFHRTRSSNSHP